MRVAILGVVAAIGAVGCGGAGFFPDLSNASGDAADYEAIADGSGRTQVRACLRHGFSFGCSPEWTHVLKVSNDRDRREMGGFSSSTWGSDVFVAVLEGDTPGSPIEFAWLGVGGTAPHSIVALPPAFELLSPTPDEIFAKQEDIVMIWEPTNPDGVVQLDVDITCESPGFGRSASWSLGSFADVGVVVVQAGELDSYEGDCHGELTLSRQQTGTLDPFFTDTGSTIKATQSRSMPFFRTP